MSEEVLQLSLRWTHLVAGVLWVGLTFTLAWVLPRAAATESGQRLSGWLRLGALAAWLSGAALLTLLYYSGRYPYLLEEGLQPALSDWLPAFLGLGLGFLVYDPAVSGAARRGPAALAEVGPWLLLACALAYTAWLERAGFSRRAMHVHAGAWLATAMLANVWARIAPALRAAASPERAGACLLRSRHNARLSIPLLLLMVSVDQPTLLGNDPWQASLGGVLALGYGLGWLVERALPEASS